MKRPFNNPIRTNRLQLPLGTMFWHEAGKGRPLVLLHGSWQDSTQWRPILSQLAADYHCVAPDLLGFGESSSTRGPCSIAVEVESIHGLLTTLRLGPCVLVAHSLGAWVAVQYALRYPDQVQGLVVVEPEGVIPEDSRGRWWRDRALVTPLSPLTWWLGLLERLGQGSRIKALRQRQQLLQQAPTACRLLFQRRAREIKGELVQGRLSDLTLPVVVVESDQATAMAHGLTLAFLKALPTAGHRCLPGDVTSLGLAPETLVTEIQQLIRQTPTVRPN